LELVVGNYRLLMNHYRLIISGQLDVEFDAV
jgi:hypothetical protein